MRMRLALVLFPVLIYGLHSSGCHYAPSVFRADEARYPISLNSKIHNEHQQVVDETDYVVIGRFSATHRRWTIGNILLDLSDPVMDFSVELNDAIEEENGDGIVNFSITKGGVSNITYWLGYAGLAGGVYYAHELTNSWWIAYFSIVGIVQVLPWGHSYSATGDIIRLKRGHSLPPAVEY